MRTRKTITENCGKKSLRRFGVYAALTAAIASAGIFSTACSEETSNGGIQAESSDMASAAAVTESVVTEITTAPESIPPLDPDGQLLPNIAITVPQVEPMPEYIE